MLMMLATAVLQHIGSTSRIDPLRGVRIGQAAHPGPTRTSTFDDPEDWCFGEVQDLEPTADDSEDEMPAAWASSDSEGPPDGGASNEARDIFGDGQLAGDISSPGTEPSISAPSHPANSGLTGSQIEHWQRAEKFTNVTISKKIPTVKSKPSVLIGGAVGDTFRSAKAFSGALPGYFFGTFDDKTGYILSSSTLVSPVHQEVVT